MMARLEGTTLGMMAFMTLAAGGCGGQDASSSAGTEGSGGASAQGSTGSASSNAVGSTSAVASTGAVATSSGTGGGMAFVCDPPAAPGSIYERSAISYDINAIDPVSMCKYRGDVMLIVNTAAL